jgi:hypothetical protein
MRPLRLLTVILVPVVALIMTFAAPNSWADVIELDEAEIFFEYNSTDQDLGIHFFLDGEGWRRITIFTPDWRRNVTVSVRGEMGQIGLTEIFSESAEPSLCPDEECEDVPDHVIQAAIDEFLEQFPEGDYRFYGWTVEGGWLFGESELTYDLPAAPVLNLDDFPIIKWTQPAECPYEECPEIVGYEVVAEMEAVVGDEEREFVNTATLPGNATSFTVSPEFAALAEAYKGAGALIVLKAEVIAREESGNKTITEEALFELPDEE